MDTADPKTYGTTGQVPRIPGRTTPPPPPLPAWNYNPLHDVESVYWLTKFFTENHDVVFVSKDNGSELDEDALTALELRQDTDKDARGARLDAQSNQVWRLFHELSERYTELTTPRNSPDEWHIHPTLTDYGMYTDIEAIRVNLIKEYRKVENNFISDPPKPWAFLHNAQLYVQCFGALNTMHLSVQAMPARVRLVPLAVAVQSHDAKKITRAQSAPAIAIHRDNIDNPSNAAATGGITERLESLALGPSTTNQLRPASRNEPRPGSRTVSRAPSRAPSRAASRPPSRPAPGPPSLAAPRPASRTGLRSQSRAGRNPSPNLLPNSVPDAPSSLHPASRPASRAAPRSTSRAQTKPSDAGGSSTGATARERASSQPRPPSAGGLNTGKGKGRATTPIPPIPPIPTANARPGRAQATKSKPGKPKPGWR